MARLSAKWCKWAVNNKIWKEKEKKKKKPQRQDSERVTFPPLGNSSVSRTDWEKFWFIEPDCFVWNLTAWRAFDEIKAAFSVVPAGFVRGLVLLLMRRFAQSALPLAPAARVTLRSGIPDSTALTHASWGPSSCSGSLQPSQSVWSY